MAAAPSCSTEFLDLIVKSGLLTEASLEAQGDLPEDATQCAAVLVAKGVLTKFQAKLLLNGRYKGFKLGSYFIREQIGQGGMGAVFLAEHETLRRKVALKVLTLPKEGNALLSIERFLREARSAAALDHPNIVRLHDVGKSGDTHYLVMEYVEGQTLDQIITKGGPISSSRAVEYIAQGAAGLQHAYEKGFVHRDIKPANLMLTKDGQIKILDMGLARPANEEDGKLTEVMDKGAIVGTADFISPEQAMSGDLDVRSDIYSLGATFFALVTGQPPFNGNTTQKLIQHQMKEAPSVMTLDKTFPAGLSAIVAKMLAKRPEQRYQTPSDVIKALAEWLPQHASARVAAAISGTDLASGELTATLSEIASGTKRLGTSQRLNTASPKKRNWFWPAIAGAVLIVAGGIAAVITLNQDKGDAKSTIPQAETSKPVSLPVLKVEPKATPSVSPTVVKAPPQSDTPKTAPPVVPPEKDPPVEKVSVVPPATPTGPLLLTLDMSKASPLKVTGKMVAPTEGNRHVWKVENTDGGGTWPSGWSVSAYGSNHAAEFQQVNFDGEWAIGVRNVTNSPTSGAMLLSPSFTSANNKAVISFDVKCQSPDTSLYVKYLQHAPARRTATDLFIVPSRKDIAWRTIRKEIDLKGGTAGIIELHPRGEETVWVRNFTIHQGGTPNEKPTRDLLLYSVNFKTLKTASQRFDNYPKTFTLRDIEGVALPSSLHINQHRADISSEYSISDVDGVRALGFRLIDGDTGVQIQSGASDVYNVLKPNDSVVTRITYRFDGTGHGSASVRLPIAPYTKYGTIKLPPTNGTWKTVEVDFTKPAVDAKYELMINPGTRAGTISAAVGTIYLQSIEIKYADAKK